MRHLLLSVLIVAVQVADAQRLPVIRWSQLYGSAENDIVRAMIPTADDGFLISGTSQSNTAHVSGLLEPGDAWVMKADANGAILWGTAIPGSVPGWFQRVTETKSHYILLGQIMDNRGVFSANPPQQLSGVMLHLHKTTGAIQQVVYAPHGVWTISDLIEVGPGRGVFALGIQAVGGRAADLWLARLDTAGTVVWQKNIGSSSDDAGYQLYRTARNTLLISAVGGSDGDFTGSARGTVLYYADTLGNKIATTKFRTDYHGTPVGVWESDGGYPLIAGHLFGHLSHTGMPGSGFHGDDELVLSKFNRSSGSVIWSKCYGGSGADRLRSACKTADNGAIMLADGWSTDGDLSGNIRDNRSWIVRVDSNGKILWQRSFGNQFESGLGAIGLTCDNNYVLASGVNGGGGDARGTAWGGYDFWLCKFGEDGLLSRNCAPSTQQPQLDVRKAAEAAFRVYPQPASQVLLVSSDKGTLLPEIMIEDVMGRILYRSAASYRNTKLSIDVSGWARGVYLLKSPGMPPVKISLR